MTTPAIIALAVLLAISLMIYSWPAWVRSVNGPTEQQGCFLFLLVLGWLAALVALEPSHEKYGGLWFLAIGALFALWVYRSGGK
jgi:hypothetical protein